MKTLIIISLLVACLLVLVVFVMPRTPMAEPAHKHSAAPVWNTSAIQSTFRGRASERSGSDAGKR